MRCAGTLPKQIVYRPEVHLMRNTEKYNATVSGKLKPHMKKVKINTSVDRIISDYFVSDYIDQM